MDEMRIFIVYMDILSPSNLLKSPSFVDRMIRNDIRNKYRNNNTNKASNESINESLNSNSW